MMIECCCPVSLAYILSSQHACDWWQAGLSRQHWPTERWHDLMSYLGQLGCCALLSWVEPLGSIVMFSRLRVHSAH
jgi:hypothetical protein